MPGQWVNIHSPSWDGNSFAAKQEVLKNPKVHYHKHNSPLLVHIISHINPANSLPPHFLKIHFTILPSTLLSFKCSLSFLNNSTIQNSFSEMWIIILLN